MKMGLLMLNADDAFPCSVGLGRGRGRSSHRECKGRARQTAKGRWKWGRRRGHLYQQKMEGAGKNAKCLQDII